MENILLVKWTHLYSMKFHINVKHVIEYIFFLRTCRLLLIFLCTKMFEFRPISTNSNSLPFNFFLSYHVNTIINVSFYAV